MRSLSVALVLALAILSGSGAHAQSFVEMLDDARLFAEPNAYADVVTTMPEESVAELLQCKASWCEVRFGDTYGYVRQRYLMATDRRPPAPPPAPVPPPTPAPTPAPAPRPAPAPPPVPSPAPEPVPAPPPRAAATNPTPTSPDANSPRAAGASEAKVAPEAEVAPEARSPDRAVVPRSPSAAAPARVAPPPEPAPPPKPTTQRPAARPAPSPEPPPAPRFAPKSPATGTALSAFLPGAGHLYAGEPGAGTALLLAAVSAPAVGYLLSDRTADPTCTPSPLDPQSTCTDRTDYGPLFVGIGIAATAWVAGLIDAGAAARRANERHQTTNLRLDPVVSAGYAGLALRVSL